MAGHGQADESGLRDESQSLRTDSDNGRGGLEGVIVTRILQVGDLHYPEWRTLPNRTDLKDKGFSSTLATSISSASIQVVLRRIAKRVYERSYDYVCLVGDLTTNGDLPGYEAALKQLTPLLLQGPNRAASRDSCIIVPGNHDVNRPLAESGTIDSKFNPLNEYLAQNGLNLVPVRSIKQHAADQKSLVALFSMNSCLGCQEKHYLSEPLRALMLKSLKKSSRSYFTKSQLKQLDGFYELIDTPSFDDNSIQELLDLISQTPRRMVPIIVAHHNLLPQATPRIAIYTELINGGRLRRTLLNSNRAVLYLHGHIHTDPIEVVTDPNSGSQIVIISAPRIDSGFNEIELFTLNPNDGPCGGRVVPYRVSSGSALARGKPVYFPVGVPNPFASSLSHAVMRALATHRQLYWPALLSEITKDSYLPRGARRTIDEKELIRGVVALHFAGFIRISDLEAASTSWTVSL